MTKITIDRSVVEQVLETLEAFMHDSPRPYDAMRGQAAMGALRAALTEPVQEPVAWMVYIEDGKSVCVTDNPNDLVGAYRALPIYTTPPQRKPLTEEEIEMAYREIWRALPTDFEHTSSGWIEQGIKYAERAHGIGEAK